MRDIDDDIRKRKRRRKGQRRRPTAQLLDQLKQRRISVGSERRSDYQQAHGLLGNAAHFLRTLKDELGEMTDHVFAGLNERAEERRLEWEERLRLQSEMATLSPTFEKMIASFNEMTPAEKAEALGQVDAEVDAEISGVQSATDELSGLANEADDEAEGENDTSDAGPGDAASDGEGTGDGDGAGDGGGEG